MLPDPAPDDPVPSQPSRSCRCSQVRICGQEPVKDGDPRLHPTSVDVAQILVPHARLELFPLLRQAIERRAAPLTAGRAAEPRRSARAFRPGHELRAVGVVAPAAGRLIAVVWHQMHLSSLSKRTLQHQRLQAIELTVLTLRRWNGSRQALFVHIFRWRPQVSGVERTETNQSSVMSPLRLVVRCRRTSNGKSAGRSLSLSVVGASLRGGAAPRATQRGRTRWHGHALWVTTPDALVKRRIRRVRF